MLRIDRACIYIIMLGMTMLIPSIQYTTNIDELCVMLFGAVAVLDCLFNNNWKRYRLLWIVLLILAFYAVYSLTVVHFNVPRAIALDFIIELKPFVPFIVIFAISPDLTESDKKIFKAICLFNCVILSIAFFMGHKAVELLVFHLTYGGTIIFASTMYYIYCSIDSNGRIPRHDLITALVFLTIGLLCLKAKYYGIYILYLYFFYLYKPGILRNFSLKHAIMLTVLVATLLAVSWHKIQYYFISGNSDTFDPKVIQSFARPVLYVTGLQIMGEFIPFGTGLASFATAASSQYYADTYYYYGIDKVHGLAPNKDFDFICDAFYPSLAQFGIIGLILFIYFWRYTYTYIRVLIRKDPDRYRYPFIIGSLIISFILIENTSATTFTHCVGFIVMTLFGFVCAKGKQIKEKDSETSVQIIQKI